MAPQSPLRQSNVSKVGNFTKETKLPICLRAHVARHLVDKNSRTICKLKYLIELHQSKSKSTTDEVNETNNNESIEKLNNKIDSYLSRMNRRLKKLAKWVDTPAEDRAKELRPPFNKNRFMFASKYHNNQFGQNSRVLPPLKSIIPRNN